MDYYSSKNQRKEDERREARSFALSLLFFIACLAMVAFLTGCSNLQSNVERCMQANRTTSYSLHGRAESFQCEAKR